jgi:hypothetical protein
MGNDADMSYELIVSTLLIGKAMFYGTALLHAFLFS